MMNVTCDGFEAAMVAFGVLFNKGCPRYAKELLLKCELGSGTTAYRKTFLAGTLPSMLEGYTITEFNTIAFGHIRPDCPDSDDFPAEALDEQQGEEIADALCYFKAEDASGAAYLVTAAISMRVVNVVIGERNEEHLRLLADTVIKQRN